MVVVTACSEAAPDRGTSVPTPAATSEKQAQGALDTLTVEELPGLMLSSRQLGSIGSGILIANRSGFTSDLDVADRFPALKLGVDDIETWGREGGFLLAYDRPRFWGEDRLAIEVGVELFRTSKGALTYIESRQRELSLDDSEPGVRIETAEPFELGQAGGRGLVVIATRAGYDVLLTVTTASIQRGRLVSWVSVVDFEPDDRTSFVARTASIFDDQIAEILEGGREPGNPAEEPWAPSPPWRAREDGDPDLAPLTLDESEIPDRFHLTWSGYVADPSLPHSYNRDFADQPFAKLTTLPLTTIRITVSELSIGPDYALFIDEQRTRTPESMAEALEAATVFRDLQIERSVPNYGETALLIVAQGRDPQGSLEYGTMWIDEGDFGLRLVVSGPTGLVTRSEILEIAEAAGRRFSSGLPEQ